MMSAPTRGSSGALASARDEGIRHAEGIVRVDVALPVDPLAAVPLPVLALLVEVQQAVTTGAVVPVEEGGLPVTSSGFGCAGDTTRDA